jgi:hypothetical protein
MTLHRGLDALVGKRSTIVISILLFFVCLGMGGAAIVRVRHGEPATGWALAAAASALALVSAPYWARVLPGIFGCAALNSLVSLLSGHQLGRTNVAVPRAVSGTCLVVFFVAAILSKRFGNASATVADRIAIFGAIASLLVGLMDDSLTIPAVMVMLCCIGISWIVARVRSQKPRSQDRERRAPELL